MKTLKSFFFLTSLLLIIIISNLGFVDPSKQSTEKINEKQIISTIKIVISLDTNSFIEAQSIWLNVEFKNIGSKKDSLTNINGYGVYDALIITDRENQTFSYKGLEPTSLKENYFVLQPNESKFIDVELRDVFGDNAQIQKNRTFSPRNFFSKGEYTLRIEKYSVTHNTTIISNTISFEVTPPSEQEKESLISLKAIYDMQDLSKQEQINKINAYKNFLINNVNSRYFDDVFYRYIRMRSLTELEYNNEIVNELSDYLEKNVNKHEAQRLVWHYADANIRFKSGKSETKKILNILSNKYPNTRLEIGIKRTLKSNLFKNHE